MLGAVVEEPDVVLPSRERWLLLGALGFYALVAVAFHSWQRDTTALVRVGVPFALSLGVAAIAGPHVRADGLIWLLALGAFAVVAPGRPHRDAGRPGVDHA